MAPCRHVQACSPGNPHAMAKYSPHGWCWHKGGPTGLPSHNTPPRPKKWDLRQGGAHTKEALVPRRERKKKILPYPIWSLGRKGYLAVSFVVKCWTLENDCNNVSKLFHNWHTLKRVTQQCRCPTEHWTVELDPNISITYSSHKNISHCWYISSIHQVQLVFNTLFYAVKMSAKKVATCKIRESP